MAETAPELGALSQAVVFLNHFRDLPDPRQTGKALYPLEEVVLLSRLRGSAFAEIPPLEGSKCNKNVAKVRAENARYRLKPYASTSRKDGSPNERFSPWGDLADLVLHRRGTLTPSPPSQLRH